MIEKASSVSVGGEKKRNHVHALISGLIVEHMRQVLTYCENVSFSELTDAVTYVKSAFPFDYAADLNLLVLMELGEEVICPVFLENQGSVFGFGYAERQDFHELKIGKYYLKNHAKLKKKVI